MLFKSNPTYGLVPVQVEGVVTIRDFALAGNVANRQVLPSAIAVTGSASNTGTANAFLASSDYTLKPGIFAQPFTVFCNPNGSVAGAATNTATLPLGLSAGGTTINSEYVIDFSAFPADITAAQATMIQGLGRNAANYNRQAVVSAIDNANKLVYVNVVDLTGAPVANVTGSAIFVDLQFVDYQFGG